MLAKIENSNIDRVEQETLDTYILKENEYSISKIALYTAFKHRSKVEFLKFFIV